MGKLVVLLVLLTGCIDEDRVVDQCKEVAEAAAKAAARTCVLSYEEEIALLLEYLVRIEEQCL